MNLKTDLRQARVRSCSDVTSDVRVFEIEPEGAFVPASPGSHIDVSIEIDGRPATRSYSTIGPGADGAYRIAVKLSPDNRGGSAYMWTLKPGARLTISTPANHFELNRDCGEYLLVAGGIGITPVYAMAMALAESGAKFRLLYGCRDNKDAAFADELASLLGSRLEIYASNEGRRVDIAAAIASLGEDGEFYVCGPIGMLDEARAAWARSGRSADRLRFETFANSGRYPNAPFTVTLPYLGRTIEVAKTQTLLEALETAGIEAMYDCRRGECGLCALDVMAVDGVIDHRDVFFSEEEKAEGHKLCACVSRMAGGSISVDTGERPAEK